jgi:hypothetical protein
VEKDSQYEFYITFMEVGIPVFCDCQTLHIVRNGGTMRNFGRFIWRFPFGLRRSRRGWLRLGYVGSLARLLRVPWLG